MPGRDRTGPNGGGPMTGRGTGLCGGNKAAGRISGRGRCSAGPGARRRGFRYRDRISWDHDENNLSALQSRARNLAKELEEINARISNIDNEG
ncbi:MAG TPA: DUF5320 domain-containing protein [Spirochaetota bacterium]|nr:DUF5320 domain-containing protein [Spirochaetota bacterium]HSA16206.1 DUF5320 domain-containing protein [Spirochaetota bacterium]